MSDIPPTEPEHFSAEDVRGGEIELRRPWQRILFVAGLAGIVLLLIILFVAGR